jgi:cytochrome c2
MMNAKTLILCVLLVCGVAANADGEQGPGALFNRRCRACHTYGSGDLIGPDLKGVTERHSREWLTSWITSSQSLIRTGDPAANALFRKYKQFPMPDQSFAPGELDSLISYFASGGPITEAKRNRRAETASAAEIDFGRALFLGLRGLAAGGAPCISCHGIGETGIGGSLGPDLTRAFSRYQDRRLASLISRGCFPRLPEISVRIPLNDDEVFALKAFLRQVDPGQRPHEPAQGEVRH